MSTAIARVWVAAAVGLAVVPSACGGKKAEEKRPPPAPVDHLAPNEVPEGKEKAFGLPLPRAAAVTARFGDVVKVESTLSLEELATFVRARVKEGKVTAGATATEFDDVVVPADPGRRLTIEVRRATVPGLMRSEMIVRDTTPPPLDPNESVEERMRKAGLTPDGRLIDPKKIE